MRLAVLALVVFAACKRDAPDPVSQVQADARGVTLETDAPQWRYVELAVAQEGPSLAPLPVPGRVELDPKRSAALGVPLPGRVETVLLRLGARVKQGERLFSVRSGAYAELDRELEAARAQVTVRERLVTRAKELLELKAAAQKDVLAAEADLRDAELALKAAKSKQRSLDVDAESDNLFWVRSPRAGTIVELSLSPGQEVGPEIDRPLVRVSDLDEVLVIADVPEGDVRDVHVGATVAIHPRSVTAAREGTVEYVSEVVEPRRRTVEVWIRARNVDRLLRPNGFVEVTVEPGEEKNTVRVPDSAVVTQGQRSVVFVVTGPNRLEPREVELGRRRDGETEIRRGLEPGVRFVARGALLLLNQVDLASDS